MSAAAWSIAIPSAAGALCFLFGGRARKAVAIIAVAATTIAAAALVLAAARDGADLLSLGDWPVPLAIRLRIDGLSAFMVALQAGVGALVSIYAFGYFRGEPYVAFAWPMWLLLWAGLNGLYLTNDLFNAYVALELVGVTAVGLVAMAGKEALAAGLRYLLVTLIGSLLYLAGVALVYAEAGAVDMDAVRTVIAGSRGAQLALALMASGLLLKTAAFPLHFWLPPAHANAAAPASAILSGLVIKGSLYLLLRLWHAVFAGDVHVILAELIGALGIGAVVWGSLQALRQNRLKMLIAYSTVAQVGYLLMAFPLGERAWHGALYFAAAHACAKAAMFTASGTVMRVLGHDDVSRLRGAACVLPITMFAFALAGVALIGLPPSGGFVGKWILLEEAIGDGRWEYVVVISAGTLLAVAYVFRVINPSLELLDEAPERQVEPILEVPTLALALAALLLGLAAAPALAFIDIGSPFGALP